MTTPPNPPRYTAGPDDNGRFTITRTDGLVLFSVDPETEAIASAAGTLPLTPDGVTLDSNGSGGSLEVAPGGIGPTELATDSVTAAKIAAGAVGTSELAAAGVTEAKLAAALAGTADGLGVLRVARATFDPSANAGQRTVAAHGLGVTIPSGAIIVGGFAQVATTFADGATDSATIAISVEGADDIIAAIAISNGGNPWDAGLHAIIPKANTPESTGIVTTQAREVTATVAVAALTLGKAVIFVYYVQGA